MVKKGSEEKQELVSINLAPEDMNLPRHGKTLLTVSWTKRY